VLKTRAYVNTISEELHAAMHRASQPAALNKNYRNAAAATQAAEIAAQAAQAQTQALVGVLNRVDELCAHLSATIRKSVLNLPTSSVRAYVFLCWCLCCCEDKLFARELLLFGVCLNRLCISSSPLL